MVVSAVIVALALVECVLVATLPAAVVWVLGHTDEIGEWLVGLARGCHLVRRQPPLTCEPPVERIAADLRRLSGAMAAVTPGTSAARRKGLRLAYEDALICACHALSIPQSLGQLADGMDRELERMRVEAAVEDAGLRFRSAAR